ncbi:MAG: RNA polymerase sigma factor [Polyangiaceae bacterium]
MAEEGMLAPVAATDAAGRAPSAAEPSCAAAAVHPASAELLSLLYRQIAVLAGPRPELDDLVQAAAERALKAIHRFDGRCALSTWTYTIAYRTVVDADRWHVRFRKRFASTEPEQLAHLPADWDTDAALLQLERARRLHAALARLSPKKRAVVVLVEFEGLSMREVAQIVDANERTVRSRLRDARKKLAEELAQDPLFGGSAR